MFNAGAYMKCYHVIGSNGPASLVQDASYHPGPPGPGEVRLRLEAVALNLRDILIWRGNYPHPTKKDLIPVSDGAGEIVAVGSDVVGLETGHRVMTNFFPDWIGGRIERDSVTATLGGSLNGVLAEEVVLPALAVARIPSLLTYEQAATLPCAGVTAWNALFEIANLKKGDKVLLQGTGGVSTFALQFAKAQGLVVILTSSSDDKLREARGRGADEVINYRATPEWDQEVLRLTGGQGVDGVVEVGGAGTLERSIRCTRMGGTISAVGMVSGRGEIDPLPILTGVVRVAGVFVGSHAMAAEMLLTITAKKIDPLIDHIFPFDKAAEAYKYLESGPKGAGKIVIKI
jgi:NADPH:quinone reductase-like Zn-dependent oxidoreductase